MCRFYKIKLKYFSVDYTNIFFLLFLLILQIAKVMFCRRFYNISVIFFICRFYNSSVVFFCRRFYKLYVDSTIIFLCCFFGLNVDSTMIYFSVIVDSTNKKEKNKGGISTACFCYFILIRCQCLILQALPLLD